MQGGVPFTCAEAAQQQGHSEVVALLAGAVVPGARVLVHGLRSAAGQALNGRRGVARAFDAVAGRWAVQMEGGRGGVGDKPKPKPKLLKAAKLRCALVTGGRLGTRARNTNISTRRMLEVIVYTAVLPANSY
jgi:hypothetical protein